MPEPIKKTAAASETSKLRSKKRKDLSTPLVHFDSSLDLYIYICVVKYCQHLNGIIEARHERQWQQIWRAPTTIDRTENAKCKANKDTNWPRPSPCNQSRLGTVETNLCNHSSLVFRKYKFLTNVVEQTKSGLLLAIHPASKLSKASQLQISWKHHSQPFRLQQRQQVLLFFSLKRPFCPSSFQVTKTARKEVLDGEEMSILDIPDKSLGVSPARLLFLLCEGSALSYKLCPVCQKNIKLERFTLKTTTELKSSHVL